MGRSSANGPKTDWMPQGLFLLVIAIPSLAYAEEPTKAEKLFALKVRPLLLEKCVGCHGGEPDEIEAGFDVRSRESVLRGGESYGDTVLVPGNASESYLLRMVRREEEGYEMPPKASEKLTEQQTWWIRDWINGGAPWPNDDRVAEIYEKFASGITWKTSGGLASEWTNRKYKPEDLWAYQPVTRPTVPGNVNAIDHFIDAQLAAKKLTAAPRADRRTLIRRATFDLLGLPPTPTQVDAFIADPRSDTAAFAALIDELLASKHYGEQWGRHWLDVARYADSSGFANDWERPNAWRYRDYVVRSFNNDKPYDQFVREQIAGDELVNASMKAAGRTTPNAPETEMLIAAGFLRMGPWEHTAMSVARVTRQQFLDDVTDSVGQVFLAHPLQCARCHDHKFDPIPTRDYYSMQAIFATTQFADVDTKWLPDENRSDMEQDWETHERKRKHNADMLTKVNKERGTAIRQWFAERELPYKSIAEAKKANASAEDIPELADVITPEIFGRQRIAGKWRQKFPWEADRYKPIAFTVYNGKTTSRNSGKRQQKPKRPFAKGELEQTTILTGGDPFARGESVVPAVLSAVPNGLEFSVTEQPSGRRTALANWITSEDNTLTARVMVNRIWQYHFGQGLAGTPNNFGATGKKPTHPQLLDWLASEFMANGWSVKQLHKTIMTSSAYARASSHPSIESVRTVDPNGACYAVFKPRRLAAEELRDAMLAASGELNRTVGGIPNRPDMNQEAALQPRLIMGTFAPAYVPNAKRSQRNRRSIYALKLRGHRDPFMETFNQPGTDKSCELRDSSSVSPQALTMFNSEESSDRSLAFAADVLKKTQTDDAAITEIFNRAFGRAPSKSELASTLSHWQRMTTIQQGITHEPANRPTKVTRRAIDENTGKPFEFVETLIGMEDYEPDLAPHEVEARTRALGDVCLAILNANEFIFVY